jgi:uncharacterized repeat protein (TIGR01451 family)
VRVTKNAAVPTVVAGGEITYRIYIQAPTGAGTTITKVTDVLPSGFTYVANSTIVSINDGATVLYGSNDSDCVPAGTTTLTWSWDTGGGTRCDGSAVTLAAGKGMVLSYRLKATSTAGTYTDGAITVGVGNFSPTPAASATPGGASVVVNTGSAQTCITDVTTEVANPPNNTGRYFVVTFDQTTYIEADWEIGTTNDKKVRIMVFAGTPSFVTPGSTSGTTTSTTGTTTSGGDSGQYTTTDLLWRVNSLAAGTYTVLFRAQETGVVTDGATITYSKSVCP